MNGYIGEFPISVTKTTEEWSFYWLDRYSQIEGEHHKNWVLDQLTRIMYGTEVEAVEARWDNGHTELRVWLKEPSQRYLDFVAQRKKEGYNWEVGIAP